MRRNGIGRLLLSVGLLALTALPAGGAAGEAAGLLGHVEMPNSGAETAQEPFLRGLLLLHSFEYEDAARAFRAAQQADPGFALAYWGEALTHYHPVWLQLDAAAGRAALARLAPTPAARQARAASDRDRGYLAAVETLYAEGAAGEGAAAYARAMADLSRRHPDDLEAAALYAVSLFGTAAEGRDFRIYMQAAAVAEEVFAANPRHPGAAHYLIHAYDDPVHAPLGLRPARVYAAIAPAAGHALHMPSHIFVALGMWEPAAASNEASWAAGEARRERLGLSLEARNYHALYWLQYAYLQLGRWREARELLERMAADAAASGSVRTRNHLALMRGAWAVETGHWSGDLPAAPPTQGLSVEARAVDLYLAGRQALAAGDQDAAAALAEQLSGLGAVASGGGAGYGGDAPAARQAAAVMGLELAGLVAIEGGDAATGLAQLRRAAQAEAAMPFDFGPPIPVEPAAELLGEMSLAHGEAAAALAAFGEARQRYPQRWRSLAGAIRAGRAAGDAEAAAAAAHALRTAWRSADDGLASPDLLAEPGAATAEPGSGG
ncbi:MAG TPA: hypothetical protein VMT16_07225 [Thermoanaerobaculia bacterium]|nr:hypothetical protein [Thermoanaerobaculia bacterium]